MNKVKELPIEVLEKLESCACGQKIGSGNGN